jgi:hypothetical protein
VHIYAEDFESVDELHYLPLDHLWAVSPGHLHQDRVAAEEILQAI